MWSGGVRAGFRRLCQQAGLGSDWHPHEQRHTFVSVLSDAGEAVEAIAAAAGHQNPGTTRSVYWHAISPEITSAATAMDGVLGTQPEATHGHGSAEPNSRRKLSRAHPGGSAAVVI